MTPAFNEHGVTLYLGDVLDVLPTIASSSIGASVTDPPYELGFMGKSWDASGIAYNRWMWSEVLRILKPGAYLLAFGGTRTYHRMACAIEDAGFEIIDTLAWMYGSGFPKSLDIAKAIDRELGAPQSVAGLGDSVDRVALDYGGATGKAKNGLKADWITTTPQTNEAQQWNGWGTALKPAYEPIVLAQKPFDSTIAANVLKHGAGALNIDASRIQMSENDAEVIRNMGGYGRSGYNRPIGHPLNLGINPLPALDAEAHPSGRWPANVLLDDVAAQLLDQQTGMRKSGASVTGNEPSQRTKNTYGEYSRTPFLSHDDFGGASRFFYVAKASREEREFGCNGLPQRSAGEATDREDDSAGLNSPRAGAGRTSGARNFHPTVKPIALMQYLVRLITPPNTIVFDPFIGSGTTAIACERESIACVGIERDSDYLNIAMHRVRAHRPIFADTATPNVERDAAEIPDKFAPPPVAPTEKPRQPALFGDVE